VPKQPRRNQDEQVSDTPATEADTSPNQEEVVTITETPAPEAVDNQTEATPAEANTPAEPAVDKVAVFNQAVEGAFENGDADTVTIPEAYADHLRNAFRALTPTQRQAAIMDLAMNQAANPLYPVAMAEINKVINRTEPKAATTKVELSVAEAVAVRIANLRLAADQLVRFADTIEAVDNSDEVLASILDGSRSHTPDFREVRSLFKSSGSGGTRSAGTGAVRSPSTKEATGKIANHVHEALQAIAEGNVEGIAADSYVTPNQLNGIATSVYPEPTPTSPSPGAIVLTFGRLGAGYEYNGNTVRYNAELASTEPEGDATEGDTPAE
jgi:hypothetical protein